MDQVTLLKHRLFDADAMGATNVSIFPGSSRDATPEQVAEAVNRTLSQLEVGDYEPVVLD